MIAGGARTTTGALMFGQAVSFQRRRAGLTQEDLAARTGLSVRSIRDLENGRVRRPRPSTVRMLGDAFGLKDDDWDRFRRTADAEPGAASAEGFADADDPAPVPAGSAVPAQLPLDVRGFAGRGAELAELEAISRSMAAEPTTLTIVAISGTAGVGKTTLAVHWAHFARDRFPDGQLYVNLRGFDPYGVVTADDAVRRFLGALGTPVRDIPADPEACRALYRSRLAGRRMLILLDNARDAAHVRPLLPGTGSCQVVVTSRSSLTGLVVAQGAHPLELGLLDTSRSQAIMAGRLGPDRLTADPAAVQQVIDSCAGLPLALALVCARAAIMPGASIAALAAELRATAGTLDAFVTDDPSTDVRAVLSWSYQAVSPAAARLFRLIALDPGSDVSVAAAASLSGDEPARIRPLLAELTAAGLIEHHRLGRYSCHDLLRAYAAELTDQSEKTAATHRLLDHYLQTAHRASAQYFPSRSVTTLAAPRPGVTIGDIPDGSDGVPWFAAEHQVLATAVRHAAAHRFDAYVWQLAWALATYLDRQGHWTDMLALAEEATAAARRLGDDEAQARSTRLQARAHLRLGDPDAAADLLNRALTMNSGIAARGHAYFALVDVSLELGDLDGAQTYAGKALDAFRDVGDRVWQANTLSAAGWMLVRAQRYREAIVVCTEALELQQLFGTPQEQASSLDSLGVAHHRLGNLDEATTLFDGAVAAFERAGDRRGLADTLVRRAETHESARRLDAASADRTRAAAIHQQLRPGS